MKSETYRPRPQNRVGSEIGPALPSNNDGEQRKRDTYDERSTASINGGRKAHSHFMGNSLSDDAIHIFDGHQAINVHFMTLGHNVKMLAIFLVREEPIRQPPLYVTEATSNPVKGLILLLIFMGFKDSFLLAKIEGSNFLH